MNPLARLRKPGLCSFDVMRRLKSEGTSIVYVSHRFEELYAVCDRVTVLRDGRNIVTQSLTTLNRLDLSVICWAQADEVSKESRSRDDANAAGRPVLLQAEASQNQKGSTAS